MSDKTDKKFEVKDNTFTLWKNNQKATDKHPDYRGSGKDADGKEFWISSWYQEPKNGGNKFYSCKYNLKDDQNAKGSLSLFANTRKEKDGQPDLTGNGTDPNGREFWASGWWKGSADNKFISGSITYKDEKDSKGGKDEYKQEEPDSSSYFSDADDTPF